MLVRHQIRSFETGSVCFYNEKLRLKLFLKKICIEKGTKKALAFHITMALVNLNNNNNVMQREKDKENDRNDFSNSKSKNFAWISGKKDVKFEQKSGKQQQLVENQNQKNKKEKVRRKQNPNSNNINIPRSEFEPPKVVPVPKTDNNSSLNKNDNRISTGTMTVPSKNQKNGNSTCRYQYEPNQIYSLRMQMNHPRSNSNRLTPPSYRNNPNVSPSTTDSFSRANGSNFDMAHNSRYHGMNVYPQHQWLHGGNHERYGSQQNENNWHPHQYNWNQNSPALNSFNNRLNRSWRSNNYLSQNSYRNKYPNYSEANRTGGPHIQINTDAKRNASLSPSFLKSDNSLLVLKKSGSKSSLNDKSSRSSVNSSPGNYSSELEYDSDTSKVSSATSFIVKVGSKKTTSNKRQNKHYSPNGYESKSAPEVSTLSDFRPSSENVATEYRALPIGYDGNDVRRNLEFHQQQGQPYYGSQQCLTINNWVSNLSVSSNGVNNVSSVPPGFHMYTPDMSFDVLNNNGEILVADERNQKKQR